MKISEILAKYDTDKIVGHSYGDAYDSIFKKFNREDKLNILEIGTQKGGSLRAWKEYFPNSKVTGIDIVDCVTEENRSDDINYVICDVNKFETEEMFDIVIDDGSHWIKDVIHAVFYFSQRLKPGGILVIEDVQRPEIWWHAIMCVLAPDLEYNNGAKFSMSYRDVRKSASGDDFIIFITKL